MSRATTLPDADAAIAVALAEDLGVEPAALFVLTPGLLDRDVTGSLLPTGSRFSGFVRMRSAGVVCGLPVAQRVWGMLASAAGAQAPVCRALVAEGAAVNAGDAVLDVSGEARTVLAGERTALDFVMVLSGIATRAAQWQAAAGPSLAVVDTRKTLPGLRALSKYAVAVGGAHNHRMGLFDMVLIKDNHMAAAGGVEKAVESTRLKAPGMLVEVEADTVEQAARAAAAGADMVLLDNMDDATIARAVAAVREATPAGRECLTEASGGVTLERLAALAATGVDRVSASALTLAPPLDAGLDEGSEEMSGVPDDDDGFELSYQAARRSCSALLALPAFFWATTVALMLLVPQKPREQPLLVGLMVAVALSVVTAAPFIREWMARRTIGEHLEAPVESRSPRHVYGAFANAATVGILVAHTPALCGFVATIMTRDLVWLALGTVVTGGVWIGLWPRRKLWERWTWQAKLRREGAGFEEPAASAAQAGPPAG